MSNEIITANNNALSINAVKSQINLIQQVMRDVMKENEHYGKIPGCGDKPVLLKSGAEKLCLTFRLAPKYHIAQKDYPKGHREYIVTTTLVFINKNEIYGEGVGSCSTMENKYRFRWENTEKYVPKNYWDNRDKAILGGHSYAPRKIKNEWFIFHKVEHDNPADYFNTILKMAKKRSLVDSILTVTAASDIFTQDLEEMEILDENNDKNTTKQIKLSPQLQIEFDEFKEIYGEETTTNGRTEMKTNYKKSIISQAEKAKTEEEKAQLRLLYKQIEAVK